MNPNLITALAGVLGSLSGASAAIATTWISQKSQTIRERAKSKTRKRETLYREFHYRSCAPARRCGHLSQTESRNAKQDPSPGKI
jgi:hypothetical protein